MSNNAFWSERLNRFGHTGWCDPAIYAYDQRLRILTVEKVVRGLADINFERALDFGCGVGDFSSLLSRDFYSVIGFDISRLILEVAEKRVLSPRVFFTEDWGVAKDFGLYNLILSITVLQHLLEEDELQKVLDDFYAALAPMGRVVALETMSDTKPVMTQYFKGRSLIQLSALFERSGFILLSNHGFQHPTEASTTVFTQYRNRFDVRILRRLAMLGIIWAQQKLDSIAQKCVHDDFGALQMNNSPTRLLVFGRRIDF